MARLVLLLCVSAALVAARPLQWFSDEAYETPVHANVAKDMSSAVERDWQWPTSPAHMHEMSSATSFLQTTTGGHPLECDCERVKCNCVKRCECGLPAAAQNRQAAQFIELASATGKSSAPLWVDVDTNECFLETGESVGQDTHHMLDCECDKVKCNCVKHCECSLPAAASGAGAAASDLLQLEEGTDKPAQKKAEVVEKKVAKEEVKKVAKEAVQKNLRSRLTKSHTPEQQQAPKKSDASASASASASGSASGSASASGSYSKSNSGSDSASSYSDSNEASNSDE